MYIYMVRKKLRAKTTKVLEGNFCLQPRLILQSFQALHSTAYKTYKLFSPEMN